MKRFAKHISWSPSALAGVTKRNDRKDVSNLPSWQKTWLFYAFSIIFMFFSTAKHMKTTNFSAEPMTQRPGRKRCNANSKCLALQVYSQLHHRTASWSLWHNQFQLQARGCDSESCTSRRLARKSDDDFVKGLSYIIGLSCIYFYIK